MTITTILNSYRRPVQNIADQVKALREQTIPPDEIWLWRNYHDDSKDHDYSGLDIDRITTNDYNWKFYGRFTYALMARTTHIAFFDDDTIPGKQWLENCLDVIKIAPALLGTVGIILREPSYFNHVRVGFPSLNEKTIRVDLVGHAWFLETRFLPFMWFDSPPSLDNGEDIHLSHMLQKYCKMPTYCPPHPANNLEMHGSIRAEELGVDDKAASCIAGPKEWFRERSDVVKCCIARGWKTVLGVEK